MKNKGKVIIISSLLLGIIAVVVIVISRHYDGRNERVIEGRIEADEYHASSKIAGRISAMYVAEGDWVNRGELLYTISTPELDAKLAQVEALRREAEAMNEQVDMGARIEQIEAAHSLLQQASAGRELAAKSFRRVEELYFKGVVPRQQYDEARTNLEAMAATEQAARAQYDLVLAGATKEQREAVAAKVAQAQGAVEEVDAYISDAHIYAPVSGRVSVVAAHEGELVGAGYPVVTILDVASSWATFNIREDDLHGIAVGDCFKGYLPALERDCEFEIYYIASEADYATWNSTRAKGGFDLRSFEVRARPASGDVEPLPGMSVIVRGDRL